MDRNSWIQVSSISLLYDFESLESFFSALYHTALPTRSNAGGIWHHFHSCCVTCHFRWLVNTYVVLAAVAVSGIPSLSLEDGNALQERSKRSFGPTKKVWNHLSISWFLTIHINVSHNFWNIFDSICLVTWQQEKQAANIFAIFEVNMT